MQKSVRCQPPVVSRYVTRPATTRNFFVSLIAALMSAPTFSLAKRISLLIAGRTGIGPVRIGVFSTAPLGGSLVLRIQAPPMMVASVAMVLPVLVTIA